MRLACWRSRPASADFSENCFREMPKVRAGLALRVLRGKETKKNSERFFCTLNPPVSRGELAAEPFAPLSFFFFAKKFFRGPSRTSGIPESVYSERGPTKLKSGSSVTLANEADRSNILASGLLVRTFFGLTFFPPSPLSEHRLQVCVPLQRLARGKSYPVTAAQLLRFHT